MIYTWRDHARRAIPAQAAGEGVEAIRVKHGHVTADLVVSAAKSKRSPLHNAFEWDDSAAAHEYRLSQARHLIRHVVVTMEVGGEERNVRAFVALNAPEEKGRDYQAISVVLGDKELRQQALDRALGDMEAFERRYNEFEELFEVFAAMRQVRKRTALCGSHG